MKSIIFLFFFFISRCAMSINIEKYVTIKTSGLSVKTSQAFKDNKKLLCDLIAESFAESDSTILKQMAPFVVDISYSASTGGCIDFKSYYSNQSIVSKLESQENCVFLNLPSRIVLAIQGYKTRVYMETNSVQVLSFISRIITTKIGTANSAFFWVNKHGIVESISIRYYNKYYQMTGIIQNNCFCSNALENANKTKTSNYYFFKLFNITK